MRARYSEEKLRRAAAECRSVVEVMRWFGIVSQSGGVHAHITFRLKQLGIDTSHFLRGTTGKVTARRRPASDILKRVTDSFYREDAQLLRRALLEVGVKEQCRECGQGPVWRGEPLRLEIDHIDGDKMNNEQKNLRFICPNCHSQTKTYKVKNARRMIQRTDAGPL